MIAGASGEMPPRTKEWIYQRGGKGVVLQESACGTNHDCHEPGGSVRLSFMAVSCLT